MPPKPPPRETTISVTATRSQEIPADKVDLQVTIKGSSLVTDSAALKTDPKPMQMEWLGSCIAEAKERAAHIAAALGVKLLAIRSFTEVWKDPEEINRSGRVGSRHAVEELTRPHAVDLGFSLSHSKTVEQRVDLTFVVDRGDTGAAGER